MGSWSALVVDDEPLARRALRRLLERDPEIVDIHEAGDGPAALAKARDTSFDVLFLDVRMPGMDGFEVLRGWPSPRPAVVFVTAYDQYAIKAFERQAMDYLLKPFSEARFQTVLDRVKAELIQKRLADLGRRVERQPGDAADSGTRGRRDRIVVTKAGRKVVVPVEEIRWLEAADYYVRLHATDGASHLVRETLGHLESSLDPSRFVRIHRSAIIARDEIREIVRRDGRVEVALRDGRRVPVSRSRVPELLAAVR